VAQKRQEELRRQKEVEEKKQKDAEEKLRRLEEAEKKRQAMMKAQNDKNKGPNFTIQRGLKSAVNTTLHYTL
jgi:troponin T